MNTGKCGTVAGHAQHARDKTPMCRPCKKAHANQMRRWRGLGSLRVDVTVPAFGTVRRLRALAVAGFTADAIAAETGIQPSHIRHLWREQSRFVMATTHRAVAASLLAVFTVVVDNTKVNVALPTLAHALAADETTLQWIVESYVLAFAAPLLLGGAIADRFGPAATMRAGLVGFAAGSVVAAVAPSAGVLVAARVLTGVAAAPPETFITSVVLL